MDGVDAVDRPLRAVLGVVGLMRGDLQVAQYVDVCGRLVRGDGRARADAVAEGLRRAPARDRAAPRDLEEGGVRVADARHDADLLAGEAAPADLLAAMARLPRQGEGALGVVALEGLGEVRLVELAGAAPPDAEIRGVRLEALDEPEAHGPGGLEADAASGRALAQREHEREALGVGHPGLARQPAPPEHPAGGAGEGPATAAAEVALVAVPGSALLDDGRRSAAGAALDFVVVARRVIEHGGADDVPDQLDGFTALGPAELRQALLEGDDQVVCIHGRSFDVN